MAIYARAMIREEEILKAARDYNRGITLSSPSNVIHFENGAKWADEHPKSIGQPKNIWHHASEEPQGTDWRIICQDEEGKFWIIDWADVILLYNTWNTYVTIEKLIKWAYIDELIK